MQIDRAEKPQIAITIGDPAGVGPETIAAVWPSPALHDLCRPVVIGHPEILRKAIQLVRVDVQVESITDIAAAHSDATALPCLWTGSDEAGDVPAAQVSAAGGQAAYDAVVAAAKLALSGQVDGITTAPLNKAALQAAGHDYPGHTELLADLCSVKDFAMMLHLPSGGRVTNPIGLNIVHTTLHIGLRAAMKNLRTEDIVTKGRLIHATAQRLMARAGIERPPRIAACALNPHAGEGGLFGDEEATIIAPAVKQLRGAGIDAHGPLPTDTLISQTADGAFDALVAMYHDQGHIAVKLLNMYNAVNITLGLPIVRTSVAHGTAFDLAWQGRAESAGLIEAVRMCAELARQFGRCETNVYPLKGKN